MFGAVAWFCGLAVSSTAQSLIDRHVSMWYRRLHPEQAQQRHDRAFDYSVQSGDRVLGGFDTYKSSAPRWWVDAGDAGYPDEFLAELPKWMRPSNRARPTR
jgi:hypothetical protein